MTWFFWVLAGYMMLSILLVVGRTGTTRTYTIGDALTSILEGGGLIALIVWYGLSH